MAKKLLVLGVALIMCLGIFSGCGGNKYNAELHYNAQSFMKAEYLESNMTLGAYPQESQIEDISSPETRTHIIRDKNSFDSVFSEFPKDVDFADQMLLIYFFTSSFSTSPYKIGKVSLDRNTFHIEFKLSKSGSSSIPNAAKPQQTCIVVLMDKHDIEVVIFKQI